MYYVLKLKMIINVKVQQQSAKCSISYFQPFFKTNLCLAYIYKFFYSAGIMFL